jgi:uncharacterized protein (TIGR03067 family)
MFGCVCLFLVGCVAPGQEPSSDLRLIEGRWAIVLNKGEGDYLGDGMEGVLKIKGNELQWDEDLNQAIYTVTLDATKTPHHIDLVFKTGRGMGKSNRTGIYEIDGNKAQICISRTLENRPTAFDRNQGYLFQRQE